MTDSAGRDGMRTAIQNAVDQAYREMVLQRSREDWMRHLCAALAQALDVALVMLVRKHASGTLEVEASSRESSLWAEMLRLPERTDGTIAGNGPAARALRQGEAQTLTLDDEGLLPWRDAARHDRIVAIRAVPFEQDETAWALMVCTCDIKADLEEAGTAAAACAGALAAAQQLERDRLLAVALRQSGNAAFISNLQGEIVWCNAAFGRLTGYPCAEVLGRNPRFLSSGRHGVRHYRELWSTIRSGRVWRGETVDRDRSGTAFTALQTITPFGADGKVTHYLAVYDDVTRQTREDIRRQLRVGHDPLTGLMHRAALEFQLAQAIEHGHPVRIARVASRRLAALETFGPEVMENVMTEIQERLASVAGSECAARLGAGDYLVCLPEDEHSARQIVDELKAELMEPYPVVGDLGEAGLRVAVACSPGDGLDVDALLRAADRALGAEPLQAAHRKAGPMLDSDTLGTAL